MSRVYNTRRLEKKRLVNSRRIRGEIEEREEGKGRGEEKNRIRFSQLVLFRDDGGTIKGILIRRLSRDSRKNRDQARLPLNLAEELTFVTSVDCSQKDSTIPIECLSILDVQTNTFSVFFLFEYLYDTKVL